MRFKKTFYNIFTSKMYLKLSKMNFEIFKTKNYRRSHPIPPPPAVTSKVKGGDRYIVMGVDFGIYLTADFDDAI